MTSVTCLNILFLIFVLAFYDVRSAELDGCEPISPSLTAKKTGQKAWDNSCDAISSSLTVNRAGQKAWDKCIEYQERYVYPCEESSVPGASPQRGDYCKHDSFAQNDTDNADNKLNYVVSLGFESEEKIKWLSGGTVISEKYILTSAHSVESQRNGIAKFVYLGTPVKNKDIDQSRLYKIKTIVQHPDYKSPGKYHDIGLIETEELMRLNKYIRPACLHTSEPLDYDEATLISRIKSPGIDVIELKLTKLSNEECSNYFPKQELLISGYADELQMCYEDKSDKKQMYLIDIGCPLQVKSDKINCMNIVIGVSSFGKDRSSKLTVFTRVSHYLPWIESIVWP